MNKPIVVCTSESDHTSMDATHAALALGRQLSQESNAKLAWLIMGELPAGASAVGSIHGVHEIAHAGAVTLTTSTSDAVIPMLAEYCKRTEPQIVIAAQTARMRTVLPRLAARLGSGIVANCMKASANGGDLEVVAATHGGNLRSTLRFTGPPPHFILLMPGATETPTGNDATPMPELSTLDPIPWTEERVRVLEAARPTGPRLEDAQVVVSGGRGLGDRRNFDYITTLAHALGGMAAASRPLVDAGWVDPTRQVGLTGRVTKPRLYIAVGISGASQHMAGCSAARVIVAINRDRHAPIFRHSQYGIVADCAEILPALIKVAQEQV